MSYNAEILADSSNTFSDRITTFKLTYPRIVHAELMTHRMFSRNAASSRAVPVKKMIRAVKNNMFTPLAIQKSHKGMQGVDYFQGKELQEAQKLWIESGELALQQAEKMEKLGITKQLINRILEPYQYYEVLVTATEWENFFKLRCPEYEINGVNSATGNSNIQYFRSKKDALSYLEYKGEISDLEWLQRNKSQADIHIQAIAELMWDEMNESTPKELKAEEWHIPYGDDIDIEELKKVSNYFTSNDYEEGIKRLNEAQIKIATARCARISYQTLGDNPKIDYEADIRLHDILTSNGHESPLEHIGQACDNSNYYYNLKGFKSYRYLFNKNYK